MIRTVQFLALAMGAAAIAGASQGKPDKDYTPGRRGPKTMAGRIEGQSGKITFFRSSGSMSAPDRVRFELLDAVEVSAAGSPVGHTMQNVASNSFTVSDFRQDYPIGDTTGTRIDMNVTIRDSIGVVGERPRSGVRPIRG